MRSFNEVLEERVGNNPERRAFGEWRDTAVGAWLTLSELDTRARAIAARLASRVKPGERALLLYPPGFDYISAFIGCLYAGVIAVPAYPPDPARLSRTLPRLQSIVRDADAAVGLTTSDIATIFQAAGLPLGRLEWLPTDGLSDPSGFRPVRAEPSTIAFLQYTSGSTGVPKGVCVTHGNLLHNAEAMKRASRSTPDQTMVTWLPPYHDLGLIGSIIHSLYVGFSVVQMAPAAFLIRPLRWLTAISTTRASMSGGPNFAFDLCAQKITAEQRAELDLSSWEFAYVAAEPVRPRTLERFVEVFSQCGFRKSSFWPCFGLAESTLLVSGGQRGSGYRVKNGNVSLGSAIDDSEIAIVDLQSHEPVADGKVGEIWFRSPSVAAGYWGKEHESQAAFGGKLAGSEGSFLRTGDLGFIDGGELFVTGRIKEVMIVRGRKHYPTDIEDAVERASLGLSQHRPGGCVAFSVFADGEERIFVALEIERRTRERRRMIESTEERRRGSDRRHRPFHYRSTQPTALDPLELSRAIRRLIASDHGVEIAGVYLLRPGSIPKTSSGKKQRLLCGQQLLSGERNEDVLFAWRQMDNQAPKTKDA